MELRTAAERQRSAALKLASDQFPSLVPVSMQRRVQFAALLQFAESGAATAATTAAICPGTDHRDLESALGYLIDDGSLEGPSARLHSLVVLAEDGGLELTALGRLRLDEDDV
jgi:hypothetical protein